MITKYWKVDDLLKQAMTIDGVDLDAHVSAVVVQLGSGDAEVTEVRVRAVYLQSGSAAWGLVEVHNFSERHPKQYSDFMEACEREALKQAGEAEGDKWNYVGMED